MELEDTTIGELEDTTIRGDIEHEQESECKKRKDSRGTIQREIRVGCPSKRRKGGRGRPALSRPQKAQRGSIKKYRY